VLGLGLGPSLAASDIVINDNRVRDTFDCTGGDVVLNGSQAELTLVGECESLVVNGDNNRVAVEAVGSIHALGSNNEVTWASGLGSKPPRVTNLGRGNSVGPGGVGGAAGAKTGGAAATGSGAVISKEGGRKSVQLPGISITKDSSGRREVSVGRTGTGVSDQIVVIDNRVRETFECEGADVIVNGNDGEITLDGECEDVVVNGSGNRVSVDAAVSITTNGDRNEIRWVEGVGGSRPAITNNGHGNDVQRAPR
jgi:hypothetical protein